VGEDGLPGERILHDGDDSQPAATAGAGEDVEGEHGPARGRRRPALVGSCQGFPDCPAMGVRARKGCLRPAADADAVTIERWGDLR
jgi:hypothetical protein